MASNSFYWKDYARDNQITGRNNDDIADNVELHLHRQDLDFINMMYEANCWEEAQDYYAENAGYMNREMTSDEFNSMMYAN